MTTTKEARACLRTFARYGHLLEQSEKAAALDELVEALQFLLKAGEL